MNNEFDYFVIDCDSSIPFLVTDEKSRAFVSKIMEEYNFDNSNLIKDVMFEDKSDLKNEKYSDGFFVDFFESEKCSCVFSQKIYDVLRKEKISGLMLIPVTIRSSNKSETNFYFAKHQKIDFFDEKYLRRGKRIMSKDLLSIPLNQRRVFQIKNTGMILYHKTIVDNILLINPKGIFFTPLEEVIGDN